MENKENNKIELNSDGYIDGYKDGYGDGSSENSKSGCIKSGYEEIKKDMQKQPYTSFAIASFVLGICAIVFMWTEGIAYIPSIIGLILAIIAKKKGNTTGFATAGLWLNIIPIIGTTIILILTFGLCGALFAAAGI